MCGINGLFVSSGRSDARSLVSRMNEATQHRGPDDEGLWNSEDAKLTLGHRRLSIVDLSNAGHQPMLDAGSGNVIVFNGEIFNHKQLQKEYLSNEHFESESDTEVILKLYAKLGVNCFALLDGMFAFAIWDKKSESIILARDFSGKKPLYFYHSHGIFSFSSEVKALLTLPFISPAVDETALFHFLTFNSLPEPYTMFQGVEKFSPGSYMVISNGVLVEKGRFRQLELERLEEYSEEELIVRTRKEIERAVQARLMSDVPIGAFLSGGVDSSLVVALMRANSTANINTFTVSFPDQPSYDELKHAEIISNKFNTNHFVQKLVKDDIIEQLPHIVDIFDEPLSDTTSIPIYFISELAKQQNTKVILTGDGADEMFAGYRSYARYNKYYSVYNLLMKLPQPVRSLLHNVASQYNDNSPVYDIVRRIANNQELAWIGANGFKENIKQSVLSSRFLDRNLKLDSYQVVQDYLSSFEKVFTRKDHIAWMCYMGYRMASVNRYLFRSDRLAMAHSIETRSPFLSADFVNYALSVPSRYKIHKSEPKYIFKKAAEAYLPKSILYRKKQGFNVPIREWVNDTVVHYVEQNLDSFIANTGWFQKSEILRMVNELKKGNLNHTNNIWTIYFLMNWFNKWF